MGTCLLHCKISEPPSCINTIRYLLSTFMQKLTVRCCIVTGVRSHVERNTSRTSLYIDNINQQHWTYIPRALRSRSFEIAYRSSLSIGGNMIMKIAWNHPTCTLLSEYGITVSNEGDIRHFFTHSIHKLHLVYWNDIIRLLVAARSEWWASTSCL